jgi:plasmid maintenance system antidote protein VapI
MPKDSRYRNAQKLILAGLIKNLADLLDAVSKTPLARDMHTAPSRLNKLINQPELFTFEDCYKIAAILEVDPDKIIDLIRDETRPKKGRRK